jgi:hypothetical protein
VIESPSTSVPEQVVPLVHAQEAAVGEVAVRAAQVESAPMAPSALDDALYEQLLLDIEQVVDEVYDGAYADKGSELHDLRRVVHGANVAYARAQEADKKLSYLWRVAKGLPVPHASRVAGRMQPFIDGSGRLFVRDPVTQKALLAVPATDVDRVVSWNHNGVPGGHRAAEATQHRIELGYWWTGMAADIVRLVSECRVCNALNTVRPKTDLGTYPPPAKLEVLHVDIKPMPEASTGETAVLLGVDAATGLLTKALLSSDQKGVELANALETEWFWRTGVPRLLVSDNEGALVGKEVQALTKQYGVEMAPVAPRNPEGNGLAEAAVKVWSKTLMKLMIGKPIGDWPKMAQAAVHACNTAVSAPRKASPFKLMHGVEAATPSMRKDGLHHDVPVEAAALEAHSAAVSQAAMAEALAARSARHEEDLKRAAARGAVQRPFVVGDVVWLHNVARAEGSKFVNQQSHLGPFKVASVDASGATRVQLAVLATGRLVTWRGVGRNAAAPRWFSVRLLTHTVASEKLMAPAPASTASAPHAFQWQGVSDRTLLPLSERVAQARADKLSTPGEAGVRAEAMQQPQARDAAKAPVALEQVAQVQQVVSEVPAPRASGPPVEVAGQGHAEEELSSELPVVDVVDSGVEVIGMRGGNVIVRFVDDPPGVTTQLNADDFPDLVARATKEASTARADRVRARRQ